MASVVIVDNGGSNINSVCFALARLGVNARLSRDPDAVAAAGRVILPGVGAAGAGMSRIQQYELADCLRQLHQPVLGICLGMQLLFTHSAEGDTPCLDLLPGTIERLPETSAARVPHMGWNQIRIQQPDPLLEGLDQGWFYFVHSYALTADKHPHALALTTHGQPFVAVVRRKNFYGAQFHPEKSAAAGRKLLKNFMEL